MDGEPSVQGVWQQRSRRQVYAPIWRRLFHATAGSSIPILALFLSTGWMVAILSVLAISGLSLDLLRFQWPWLNRLFVKWLASLLKRQEVNRITGSTYMVIAALVAFLVFDHDVAIVVMFCLSLGDPAAALVGRQMPGPRLLGKSPGGTAAFIVVSLGIIGLLSATGAINYHWGLALGAVVAGLVELAPIPLDDNLTIPLIAGAVMQVAGG